MPTSGKIKTMTETVLLKVIEINCSHEEINCSHGKQGMSLKLWYLIPLELLSLMQDVHTRCSH